MVSIKSIYKEMLDYGKQSASYKFTPSELTKVLRVFVGDSDIKLKTQRDTHVGRNQIIVCASYDPMEDEANFSSITLVISYSPKQKKICISDVDWQQLCVDLIECIGHEMVHQNQFRERGYDIGESFFVSLSEDIDKRNEQEYLGNPDEIEAYGYSIAAEIYLKSNPKVLTQAHIAKTSVFKTYETAFGIGHPIVQQLLVFVHKYYAKLQGEINVKKPEQLVIQ